MPLVVLSAPDVLVMRPPVHVPDDAKVQVPPVPRTLKPPGLPVEEVNFSRMPLGATAPPVVLTLVNCTLSGVLLPELTPVISTPVPFVVLTVLPEAVVCAPVLFCASRPRCPEAGVISTSEKVSVLAFAVSRTPVPAELVTVVLPKLRLPIVLFTKMPCVVLLVEETDVKVKARVAARSW